MQKVLVLAIAVLMSMLVPVAAHASHGVQVWYSSTGSGVIVYEVTPPAPSHGVRVEMVHPAPAPVVVQAPAPVIPPVAPAPAPASPIVPLLPSTSTDVKVTSEVAATCVNCNNVMQTVVVSQPKAEAAADPPKKAEKPKAAESKPAVKKPAPKVNGNGKEKAEQKRAMSDTTEWYPVAALIALMLIALAALLIALAAVMSALRRNHGARPGPPGPIPPSVPVPVPAAPATPTAPAAPAPAPAPVAPATPAAPAAPASVSSAPAAVGGIAPAGRVRATP